jgi:hypothetical protein
MALIEVLRNMCARFVDRNYVESGENMHGKCCKMKDHLELLINELKSSLLKILQEEIKSASTSLKNEMGTLHNRQCVEGNSTYQSASYEAQEVQSHGSNDHKHIPTIIKSL